MVLAPSLLIVKVRSISLRTKDKDLDMGYTLGTWRDGGGLGGADGTSEGTSNRTWKGTCCQAQVRSGPGLVQVTAQI